MKRMTVYELAEALEPMRLFGTFVEMDIELFIAVSTAEPLQSPPRDERSISAYARSHPQDHPAIIRHILHTYVTRLHLHGDYSKDMSFTPLSLSNVTALKLGAGISPALLFRRVSFPNLVRVKLASPSREDLLAVLELGSVSKLLLNSSDPSETLGLFLSLGCSGVANLRLANCSESTRLASLKYGDYSACESVDSLEIKRIKYDYYTSLFFKRHFPSLRTLKLNDCNVSDWSLFSRKGNLPAGVTSLGILNNPLTNHPNYVGIAFALNESLSRIDGVTRSEATVPDRESLDLDRELESLRVSEEQVDGTIENFLRGNIRLPSEARDAITEKIRRLKVEFGNAWLVRLHGSRKESASTTLDITRDIDVDVDGALREIDALRNKYLGGATEGLSRLADESIDEVELSQYFFSSETKTPKGGADHHEEASAEQDRVTDGGGQWSRILVWLHGSSDIALLSIRVENNLLRFERPDGSVETQHSLRDLTEIKKNYQDLVFSLGFTDGVQHTIVGLERTTEIIECITRQEIRLEDIKIEGYLTPRGTLWAQITENQHMVPRLFSVVWVWLEDQVCSVVAKPWETGALLYYIAYLDTEPGRFAFWLVSDTETAYPSMVLAPTDGLFSLYGGAARGALQEKLVVIPNVPGIDDYGQAAPSPLPAVFTIQFLQQDALHDVLAILERVATIPEFRLRLPANNSGTGSGVGE